MSKVRVGVVGVGYLGRFHAEKYAALEEVDLVGVADADPSAAAQVSEKLHTRAFTDSAQLIGKVDAVSIVVPTAFHYRVAQQFLRQGVHVLLEKPVTVTTDQADELIGLAAQNRLILQIGHIERFNPAVTSIRPLIKSPRYMVAERAAPFTVRCTDVSVVLDLMIHDIDIVTDLAGAAPRELSAAGASVITKHADIASARIVFENGCTADLIASRISEEKKRTLRVLDGDCIYLSDYQSQNASVARTNGSKVPELVVQALGSERRDTLAEEIRAFVSCVRDGCRPLVSGIEGRRALALAELIEKNIQQGITGFIPAP